MTTAAYGRVDRHADYLRSSEWKARRARHYENPLNRVCGICGTTSDLEIHHVIYRGLDLYGPGNEPDENLLTLCANHHGEVHGEERRLFAAEPDRRSLDRDVTLEHALQNVLDRYGALAPGEPARPVVADHVPVAVALAVFGYLFGAGGALLVGGAVLLGLWLFAAPIIFALAVSYGRRHISF